MATIQELSAALVKADAAGNNGDAKVLADAIRSMQGPQPGSAEYAQMIKAKVVAGQPTPQPASPPPEWTPPDVMPAPLRAFSTHAVESVPIAGPLLHNANSSPMFDAVNQSADAQAPAAAIAGSAFGTVAPLMAGGELPVVGRLLGSTGGLASRVVAGGLSSAGLGAGDTLARGGSLDDAVTTGAIDGTVGAVLPGIGAGVKKALTAAKPSIALDALQAAKNAAYGQVDASGVRYSQQGYRDMVTDLVTNAVGDNISADRHPVAVSMLRTLVQKPQGYSPTLTQLDQLRQVVRRDVANSSDDATSHFGKQIIGGIDNFIDNASAGQLTAGSGPKAALAIKTARAANSTYRKVEALDDIVTTARRQAASTGSGGNINNALRQGVRRLLESDSRSAGFTEAEKSMLEAVVRGGKFENAARLVGKLSPSGNGLMAALGIGATAANPLLAAAPAAGLLAKHIADNATMGKIVSLRDIIAGAGAAATKKGVAQQRAFFPPSAVTTIGNRAAAPPQLPAPQPLQITVGPAQPVMAQ